MLPALAADAALMFDALKDRRTVRRNNLHNTADYLSEIIRTKMQTQKLVIKYQIEHLNQLDSFFFNLDRIEGRGQLVLASTIGEVELVPQRRKSEQ